jgi:hypothetical protein
MASGLVLADRPMLKVAVLLCIAVWCFARACYFAFYVDPSLKFAGLSPFACYLA